MLDRNKEIHYRFKVPIEQLFNEKKMLMVPVNKIPFDTAKYETRRVNKYGLIDYSSCRYSVSPKYVGQLVILKIMANEIEIFSKDLSERITTHQRVFEKGSESINYIDFIDIIKVRPNALKYTGVYSLLPDSWQVYLNSLDKNSFKQAFDTLKMILLEDDMEYADRVLRETIKYDSRSPEAIAITYKRLKENNIIYDSKIHFPSDLPIYEVDTSQYDVLIGR